MKSVYPVTTLIVSALMLPAQARPLPGQECPTTQALDGLGQRWDLPHPSQARAAADCEESLRPTYTDEKTLVDDEYGFIIHYTTSGSDDRRVTEADVEETAAIMRYVMDVELEGGMEYRRPPSDEAESQIFCPISDTDPGNGGNGYYDIYFVAEDNVYGYCQPTIYTDDKFREAASFLALSTWILDYPGALEVTVAHEFFHAVQFAYDVSDDSYWMENTATWVEDEVYDDVNDYYNYLPEAFQNPEKSLETKQLIQYAHCIWPMWMSERYGADIVQDIWEECATSGGGDALESQKVILDQVHDGGFEQAVLDFRGAMYDTSQFEEGDEYPSVSVTDLLRVNVDAPLSDTREVEHTAAEILVFETSDDGETLSLCFKGANAKTIFKVFARDGSSRDELEYEGSASDGVVTVPGLGTDVSQVALVVTYAEMNGRAEYTYTAAVGADCKSTTGGSDDTPTEAPDDGGDDGGTNPPGDDDDGCGCAQGGPQGGLVSAAWLALALLGLRRRR